MNVAKLKSDIFYQRQDDALELAQIKKALSTAKLNQTEKNILMNRMKILNARIPKATKALEAIKGVKQKVVTSDAGMANEMGAAVLVDDGVV